jgi:WhiB family transcriptional regulator, redox-sensing transcriptional regulator
MTKECDMNDDALQAIVSRLEKLRSVPDSALADIVSRDCSCLDLRFSDRPSLWLAGSPSDRDLAALLCVGCPVQDHCLELELRLNGQHTVGVWGALDESTRRLVYAYWARTRRDEPRAASSDGSRPDGER